MPRKESKLSCETERQQLLTAFLESWNARFGNVIIAMCPSYIALKGSHRTLSKSAISCPFPPLWARKWLARSWLLTTNCMFCDCQRSADNIYNRVQNSTQHNHDHVKRVGVCHETTDRCVRVQISDRVIYCISGEEGGSPGAVVKAACSESRWSQAGTPLWPPSLKETKYFFTAHS